MDARGGPTVRVRRSTSLRTWTGPTVWIAAMVACASTAVTASEPNPLPKSEREAVVLLHGLGRCYFSTETLARIEPLSEEDATGCCPRCKQGLTAGQPAVKCPGCGVWHHQSDELPCWTYAERCAICGGSTALDAGFSWTPEEL